MRAITRPPAGRGGASRRAAARASSTTCATRCDGGHARDLVERIDALHREQPPAGRDQVLRLRDEIGEVGEGARDDDVEARRRAATARRARTRPSTFARPSSVFACCEERALLVARVEQRHVAASGRAIASGMPGKPAPVPTSSERAARRSRCGRTREAVEQVQHHHLLGLAHRREVVHAVPLRDAARGARRAASRCAGGNVEAHRREALGDAARRGVMRCCFSRAAACDAALQVHQQQRDRRRRDALDARGLADGLGPMLRELLLHFLRQAAHATRSRGRREAPASPARAGARLRPSGARCSPRTWLRSRPARRRRRRVAGRPSAATRCSAAIADIRTPQEVEERVLALKRLAEHIASDLQSESSAGATQAALQPRGLRARSPRACSLKAAQRASSTRPSAPADLGEAQVGVVLAQLQAVLGAAGEHAVGLGDAARDQVVDQHAEVGLVAARAPAGLAPRLQRGVDARQQPLRGRFLVAGRAVDLAGEEEARRSPWSRASTSGRADRSSRTRSRSPGRRMCAFSRPADRVHQLQLHVERQAGRDAVRIELVRRRGPRARGRSGATALPAKRWILSSIDGQ